MKAYALPSLLWLAAAIGLVLSLLTEGFGDAVALVLLCAPLVLIGRAVLASRRADGSR